MALSSTVEHMTLNHKISGQHRKSQPVKKNYLTNAE